MADEQIAVTVNGAERHLAHGTTVEQLIALMGLDRELVAVELNRELLRRARFDEQRLAAGDRLEIVEFVGGG